MKAYTNTEVQRRFKERMYKLGFKQSVLWIKREQGRQKPVANMTGFIKELKRLTAGFDDVNLNRLLGLFIKIAAAKKEVIKTNKRAQR